MVKLGDVQETAFSGLPPFPNGSTSNIFLSQEFYNFRERKNTEVFSDWLQFKFTHSMLLAGSAISSVGTSSTLHVMDQCRLHRDLILKLP